MTREVVSERHRLDVALYAMSAHELAYGDVFFGFRHERLSGVLNQRKVVALVQAAFAR